jgi:dihydroflavonol-4-reductase
MRRPVVSVPFAVARAAARLVVAAADVTGRAPAITPAAVAIAELGLAADCARAVRELGLPQTPIDEALRDALVWFADQGYLPSGALRRRVQLSRA